jgi:hypothetical protein
MKNWEILDGEIGVEGIGNDRIEDRGRRLTGEMRE